jgi:DNA-binding MarR family transcriptional regulator/GNAT superfamily N-acetyltransferase
MDVEMVSRVRRFNRTVTQRVGALQDRYLGTARPLGEARVLWEIGREGRDVRSLRAELGLDSGYLSRLLRSLEAAGLITVETTEADRRVRIARLTVSGAAEWQALDERSDEVAEVLLKPLNSKQQARLVAAMSEVELLLRTGTIELVDTDPAHPDARRCISSYYAEINARFDAGFDATQANPIGDDEVRAPAGLFVVARLGEEPVGCGSVKFHGEICEVKRVWVADAVRGMGLGRRLLGELEKRAVDHGSRFLRLDTNKALTEAIALYRSSGFTEVPAYNTEAYAHHWFEKDLTAPNAASNTLTP